MSVIYIREIGMRLPKPNSPKKYRYVLCECLFCNKEFESQYRYFKKGTIKSCRNCSSGIRDKAIYSRTHGLRDHPIYEVWAGMKQRCSNKRHVSFSNYGGRGIFVCDLWSESFQCFYDWCISNGYQEGLEIDRMDNDGNYCPENCRFIEKIANINNTNRVRKNNSVGYSGVFRYGKSEKFYSKIYSNGKTKVLGVFEYPEEASRVYQEAKAMKKSTLNI